MKLSDSTVFTFFSLANGMEHIADWLLLGDGLGLTHSLSYRWQKMLELLSQLKFVLSKVDL